MLKKMSLRKLMVATLTLFILTIIYLIPSSNNKSTLNIKNDNIEYVYSNNTDIIYLLDSNNYIARTKITSNETKDINSKIKEIIEGLTIEGNKSNIIPNGFRSIIPLGTKVLDLNIDNKTLTINFSKELLDINKEYEEKMIEAIIYSLTSLEEIDNIIIKVEGKQLEKLPKNNIMLPKILDKSYGINKVYNINDTHNIDSFTLYYISNNNKDSYYVPVTKYINNNKQDKIKVIIDELSSAPIYETNLMSFLDVSTKLLDYRLEEDKIRLNFNNAILSDITNNNILEEVIYTISLSLNDNYNIKEVDFCVDDKEIYKSLLKNIE